MASLPTRRPISVTWYFRIAAGTAGFSPLSIAAVVTLRAASMM